MIDLIKFGHIVKSMTAKEIILAMIEGMQKPACDAVKNTVAKICGIERLGAGATKQAGYNYGVFYGFECAIDSLRRGDIHEYNRFATLFGFSKIKTPESFYLPALEDDYTEKDLQSYVKLAEYQEEDFKNFLRNVRSINRDEFSVTLTFTSCRAAGEFAKQMEK